MGCDVARPAGRHHGLRNAAGAVRSACPRLSAPTAWLAVATARPAILLCLHNVKVLMAISGTDRSFRLIVATREPLDFSRKVYLKEPGLQISRAATSRTVSGGKIQTAVPARIGSQSVTSSTSRSSCTIRAW